MPPAAALAAGIAGAPAPSPEPEDGDADRDAGEQSRQREGDAWPAEPRRRGLSGLPLRRDHRGKKADVKSGVSAEKLLDCSRLKRACAFGHLARAARVRLPGE